MSANERKQKEKDRRRQSILEAAGELLLKKGYDAVSIRQIAQLCEIGTGTIYSYFSGKEEIYAAIAGEVFDLMRERLQEAASGTPSPPEKLRRIGYALLRFSEENKTYFDFLDYFVSFHRTIFSPRLKSQVDSYGKNLLSPVIGAISAGIESGEFSPVDTLHYALIFLGSLHGIAHFRKLQDTILAGSAFEEFYGRGMECVINSLSMKQ